MSIYRYKARDELGRPVRGFMEATTQEELIEKLHKMGYVTTRISELKPAISTDVLFEKFRNIDVDTMVVFNIQLSNMINAGVSILDGLRSLLNQIGNKKLKRIISGVAKGIEAGESFSEALSHYPDVFPALFINMVKVGEASGKLDSVLLRYAEFYQCQADLRHKIKGALFYPMILLSAGIAVTIFIITYIIPQFTTIFVKAGIAMPFVTIMLYKIGLCIRYYWYIFLLVIFTFFYVLRYYYTKTKKGKFVIDGIKLNLPIFGFLYKKAAISRFARTLGTLLGSGVPILQSLDIAKGVTANEVMASVIENARNSVERGGHLAESLRVSGEMPQDVIQMVSVGEETGNLDSMLNKIAELYEMSLGYAIKRLTTVMEPALLVVMGCIIGFIMASMLLPIFDMIKILKY